MKIQTVPISKVKLNSNNPRLIKDDKFKKLVASIQSFPEMLDIRPIVVNSDMVVLGGNMRLRACKEAGLKEVPIIIADNIPEDRQAEFIIKDNVGFGEWDWEMLANEWNNELLQEWGIDLPVDFEEPKVLEAQEDDYQIPEQIKTDIVLGDLIEIGNHRLLCGDSTDSDAVARLMDGEKADMVFTDPPYGIDYNDGRWDEIQKKHTGGKSKKFGKIIGDAEDFNPSFLLSYFSYCKEIFVWGMQYYPQHLGRGGCIVWNRKTESQKDVPYVDFELCWSKQERNKMAWITWGGFKNKEKDGERFHPTQKPIELASWFFNNWGKQNDLVADLFLGSGTTMAAAHQLNRKCYGMELDPKYCQVIIDRMLKLDPALPVKRNGQPYIHQS
jgi:DNA modification methylase